MQIDDKTEGRDDGAPSQDPVAFAKINLVSPGSPSELAGIRENDELLQFGSITKNNFRELSQIADIVKHSQNQQVAIKVNRNNRVHNLSLIPKVWAGRGLLGCNIILPS